MIRNRDDRPRRLLGSVGLWRAVDGVEGENAASLADGRIGQDDVRRREETLYLPELPHQGGKCVIN